MSDKLLNYSARELLPLHEMWILSNSHLSYHASDVFFFKEPYKETCNINKPTLNVGEDLYFFSSVKNITFQSGLTR